MAYNEIGVLANYHKGVFEQLLFIIYFDEVMSVLGGLDLDSGG